ncbi:MAG: leucine-rich repeat domain-containing protein [Nodularia sp. (in: cyanobacteria)]|nr:leucine-rich repeat domain-containing protein [Nodularia sp. (in: cyanobacteria)]
MSIIPQRVLDKIQEVKQKRLPELNLSNNYKEELTEIPAEVFDFDWLQVLDLSRNKITKLPDAIARLQNLTYLDLSRNKITTLPDAIASLKNLSTLDLSDNKITTLPDAIASLQNLTSLDLRSNKITTLPDAITSLQNLTTLYLSNNEITTLPDVIDRLQNLTTLYLGGNQITTLPDAITSLQNLTKLYLSRNQITTLPDAIASLQSLTQLVLRSNQITTLPNAIASLQNLTKLSLNNNQITTLPNAIASLQNLTTLDLNGNPIEKPPPEVLVKGLEAIKNYLRQLEAEGTDYLYEAKLLIVGEGGAGKTTLANKIKSYKYQLKEEDSTNGIEVIQWQFKMKNERDFRVNIWDFGGQEIYHATHQFFLTKRSLYALVADNRKEDTNFNYWLNVVELLSDNSPVIIVKNEKQDRNREINEPQLRGRFSNLQKTLATNFATNRGLPEVLREIKHHITSLPHIGSELPKTWVKVREVLENDSRNYISLDEYLQICDKNGFTLQKDKLQLSGYLHDLGVCLHFQDDPILNNIIILKPNWGTDAVYKVLDNKEVVNNFGKFTWKELQNIWQEEQYAAKQGDLLQLMMNFNLCYEIPHHPKNYIAPQLLSEKQPEYNWNESENIILRYTYDFMPKGIVTQFIVAMHSLIDEQKYVWKSGVILSKDETKAEVIEYYDKREIKIRIAGLHKRDLLTRVTHEFDKIHDSYKQLKFNKFIPCNCSVCRNNQTPHFYKFESLRNRIAKKKYDIECDISFEKVQVLGLIDDVMDRNQLTQDEPKRRGGVTYNTYYNAPVEQAIIQQGNNEMTQNSNNEEKPQPVEQVKLPFAFRNGMFYLFVFVIVFSMIAFFGGSLPLPYLALTIIGTAIFIVLIGVLQLRQDDRLSETNTVDLIKMVLEQLPLIGNLIKQITGKK